MIEKCVVDLEASYVFTGVYNIMLYRIIDVLMIVKLMLVYSDIGLDNYVDMIMFDVVLYEMKNCKYVKLILK